MHKTTRTAPTKAEIKAALNYKRPPASPVITDQEFDSLVAADLRSRGIPVPKGHKFAVKDPALDGRKFLQGRDLAVEMLKRAHKADSDESSIEATYRKKRPQDNYVLPFLDRLQLEPAMMAGFAAVLSDYLSSGAVVDPDLYASLSLTQIVGRTAASVMMKND